jgi:hypothetical protein
MELLNFFLIKLPFSDFSLFLQGAALIIAGLILFLYGVKIGLLPLGEMIGSAVVSKAKLSLLIIVTFILGFVVTFSDPDVQVLAMQIDTVSGETVNKGVIIGAISLGVGVFLVFAALKIVFRIKLLYLLLIGYAVIFILCIFSSPDYLSVALDAGGVATGPMIVPFILSFGLGIASVLKGGNSENSFGLLSLAAIGPVIAVLIMGVIAR